MLGYVSQGAEPVWDRIARQLQKVGWGDNIFKSWMTWQYCQNLDEVTIFSKGGWQDNIFLTLSFAIAGSAFARLIFRFLNSLPYLPLTPGCVLHKYDQLGCPCKFFPQLLSGWRAWIFFSWMQENSVKDPACLKESFSRHVAGTQGGKITAGMSLDKEVQQKRGELLWQLPPSGAAPTTTGVTREFQFVLVKEICAQ